MKNKHHLQKIASLQNQLKAFFKQKKFENEASPISLQYRSVNSNTTRSKSYKKAAHKLDFGNLKSILQIDREKRIAIVEPRVTMEALLKATLSYGLTVPAVPEFKGITVGGAIMGGAAESSSHRWGCFHDACIAFEILCGDGTLLRASPSENQDVFYAVPGSYGSLGALVSAEIRLIPVKDAVHLRYHFFEDPLEAIEFLRELSHASNPSDFLDGIVFAKNLAVIIQGTLRSKEKTPESLPKFSLKPITSEWYFQHVKRVTVESHSKTYEEWMPLEDYLFRYDQGAFWMGAYFFRLPLLIRYIGQVILKISKSPPEKVGAEKIERYRHVPSPKLFWRALLHPLMTSRRLWKLLHLAEKWVQDRIVIQDFCIPEIHAAHFLQEALEDPGTFPIWLCPIKGTSNPQIFAPHLLSNKDSMSHFINIGIYGLPSYFAPIEQITRKLEQKTKLYRGRKVLYSRSYYTQDEFWEIYSHEAYEALRSKTQAKGVWHEITEKVLSE